MRVSTYRLSAGGRCVAILPGNDIAADMDKNTFLFQDAPQVLQVDIVTGNDLARTKFAQVKGLQFG